MINLMICYSNLCHSHQHLLTLICLSTGQVKTYATYQRKNRTAANETGRWTPAEEYAFLMGINQFGYGKWAKIADLIPTRTVIQVRNHGATFKERQRNHQQFPQGQAHWPGMPMPGMIGVQFGMQAMGVVPGAGENGVKPGMTGGGYPMMPFPPPMYGMFPPHHQMGPQPFGMFPAPPCVPFQPMPGQPSSNVAVQPPPTEPNSPKSPIPANTVNKMRSDAQQLENISTREINNTINELQDE